MRIISTRTGDTGGACAVERKENVKNNFDSPLRTNIPQAALDDILKESALEEGEIELEIMDDEGESVEDGTDSKESCRTCD